MMGNGAAVVAEIAGKRHLISMDKGHKLEIRAAAGPATVIESRPVTEFSAAVDSSGTLHVAAWLLSRQLMYYKSFDGDVFTRSTLLKSDGGLRLKDCLVYGDDGVSVAYVAETEYADTLVCYRNGGGEWEGRRVVEVEHPQRLSAVQFDGSPGGTNIVYGVKEPGRTVVMSRPASGDAAQDVIATVVGSLSDFCVLTSGGVRQACWIADGHMYINGLRQTEEPWLRSWPCLKREDGGIQCIWQENSALTGVQMGAQRTRLRTAALKDALPCMLALPGDLRRAIVEAQSLKETALLPEFQERPQGTQRNAAQPLSGRGESQHGGQGEFTLNDAVRNQAIYITRMQESLSAMERNMLRMQADVNRLNKEISVMMKTKETNARMDAQYNATAKREAAVPSRSQASDVNAAMVESDEAYAQRVNLFLKTETALGVSGTPDAQPEEEEAHPQAKPTETVEAQTDAAELHAAVEIEPGSVQAAPAEAQAVAPEPVETGDAEVTGYTGA